MSKLDIGLSWAPAVQLQPDVGGSKASSSAAAATKFQVNDSLWRPKNKLVDGLLVPPNDPLKLNKLIRKSIKDTAGAKWFDMPAPTITPELKRDLQILELRNAMDPKRHFKKSMNSKTRPKYLQVGTVIESQFEIFSSRLTKKERKMTLADELLADKTLKDYRKRKVQEIEEKRKPGGNRKWKIKSQSSGKQFKPRRH